MSAEATVEPLAHAKPRSRTGSDFVNPSALVAVAIWSGTAPIAKYALDEFPVLAYTVGRPIIVAALLFAWLLATRQPVLLPAADFRRIALIGVGGLGVSQLSYLNALDRTSVAHTVILASTSPLVVALYRLAYRRSRLSSRTLLGIGGGFLGVILLVSGAGGGAETSPFGDLLAFVSALSWMAVTISPVAIFAKYGTLRTMAWMFASSLLLTLPISLTSLADAAADPPSPLAWGSLLYSALFGALLANALWQRSVQQLGPTGTLVYLYLQPLGAMLLAALMLGERLSPFQALGGILVLIGVGLVRRD